jgi:hypothetical protein
MGGNQKLPKEEFYVGIIIDLKELSKMFEQIFKRIDDILWKDALKLLEEDCPKKTCEWCEGR